MLQILLLILKIIGIILAVILGIVLLMIGIVLFVPIRYEISAKCDGTMDALKAKVKVTWFFHLVRADVLVKGTKLKWQIRAAWIRKKSAMVFGGGKEEKASEKKDESSKAVDNTENIEEIAKVIVEKQDEIIESVEDNQLEESAWDSEKDCKEAEKSGDYSCVRDKTITSESKKESLSDKFEKNIEKIKFKIQSICDKIKMLLQKKDKIVEMLTDESHVRAFHKIKNELYILLKKLKPKKINLKLRFGFEDPSVTGKVLGGIAILYPVLGDTTEIIPDFEKQILKGNVYIKGRIRICHFASMAVKLLLCKDIRTSYKDIKNFKV